MPAAGFIGKILGYGGRAAGWAAANPRRGLAIAGGVAGFLGGGGSLTGAAIGAGIGYWGGQRMGALGKYKALDWGVPAILRSKDPTKLARGLGLAGTFAPTVGAGFLAGGIGASIARRITGAFRGGGTFGSSRRGRAPYANTFSGMQGYY